MDLGSKEARELLLSMLRPVGYDASALSASDRQVAERLAKIGQVDLLHKGARDG